MVESTADTTADMTAGAVGTNTGLTVNTTAVMTADDMRVGSWRKAVTRTDAAGKVSSRCTATPSLVILHAQPDIRSFPVIVYQLCCAPPVFRSRSKERKDKDRDKHKSRWVSRLDNNVWCCSWLLHCPEPCSQEDSGGQPCHLFGSCCPCTLQCLYISSCCSR